MASHLQGGMVGLQDRPVLLARALQQSCGQTKGCRIHFPVQAKGTRGLTSSIQKQGGGGAGGEDPGYRGREK